MTPALKAELEQISGWVIPEHDILEWLLQKLPLVTHHGGLGFGHVKDSTCYLSLVLQGIRGPHLQSNFGGEGNNFTDAAIKLYLALFQQNILTKEQV